MFEEEYREITSAVEKLLRESNAKCVYLVDKDGQLISSSGDTKDIDATSLASLTAGNIAATGGRAVPLIRPSCSSVSSDLEISRCVLGSDTAVETTFRP